MPGPQLTFGRPPVFHRAMDSIILASSSPRRKDLLESVGIPFYCIHPEIDESVCDHELPERRVVSLARLKAEAGAAMADAAFPEAWSPSLVLAADTLVALEGAAAPGTTDGEPSPDISPVDGWTVFGKPQDRDEAGRMTRRLAGRTHQVFTGVALLDRRTGKSWSALSRSFVTFSSISATEMEDYLDTGDWDGAAGAYRIQGRASFHIARMEGSWSGIAGLPLAELYGILSEAGFRMPPPGGAHPARGDEGGKQGTGLPRD